MALMKVVTRPFMPQILVRWRRRQRAAFDETMLQRLQALGVEVAYVTLHVGASTFQPVRGTDRRAPHAQRAVFDSADTVARHCGHAPARRPGDGSWHDVVAGTGLRRSRGELLAGHGETDIFITPGYRFQVVERLITNFHLPKSTP